MTHRRYAHGTDVPTTLRFVVPYSAAFEAFQLTDDGRILWEPRDSRLPVVVVYGIMPPVRVDAERAHRLLMMSASCAGIFACELLLLAGAWLAWRL